MLTVEADALREVEVELNGARKTGPASSRMLLTDFLRHALGATGTHVGCEHGVCGACTILLNGRAVRACLTLAVQADGQAITTVEGLERDDGQLATLQQQFAAHFALQCGFCTPGILLSATEFLMANQTPTRDEVLDLLSGHICRCTGYYPIIKAILETARILSLERQAGPKRTEGDAGDR